MMKQEKFSIRKTTVGAVSARIAVIGFLALLGTGQSVQADSVDNSIKSAEADCGCSLEQSAIKEQLTEVASQVTQYAEELAVQKEQTDVLATAVESAENDKEKASSELENAKALLQQATEENIEIAKQDIAEKEVILTESSEVVKQIEEELVLVNSTVDQAESSKSVADKEVEEAEKQLSVLEQNLEESQFSKVQDELKEANKVVEDLEKRVADLEKESNQLSASKQEAEAELPLLEQELQSAQSEVKKQLENLNSAKENEKVAEAALNNSGALSTYSTTFYTTDEWLEAWKEYIEAGERAGKDRVALFVEGKRDSLLRPKEGLLPSEELEVAAIERLKEAEYGGRDALSKVINYDENGKIIINYLREDNLQADGVNIDVTNISDAVRMETAQYFMAIINDLRRQLGIEPVQLTEETMEVSQWAADYTTSRYNAVLLGHDYEAMNLSSEKLEHGSLASEAGTTLRSRYKVVTRDEWFRIVQENAHSFIYEYHMNSHWGHARTLLEPKYKYAGIGSSYLDTEKTTITAFYHNHFIYNPYNLDDGYVPTVVAAYGHDGTNQRADYEQAVKERQEADKLLKESERIASDLNNKLVSLQSQVNRAEEVTKQFEQAKVELSVAISKRQEVENKLAGLTKSNEEKLKDLEGAKQTLADKLSLQEQATEKLVAAQKTKDEVEERLRKATETLAAIKNDLKQATDSLESLENAPTNLKQAEDKYEKITQSISDLSNDYQVALVKLDELNQAYDVANNDYRNLLNCYELLNSSEKESIATTEKTSTPDSVVEEQPNQAGGAGAALGQDKPVVSTLSGICSVDRPVLTATATASTYSRTARAAAEKSLPKTGEATSVLGLLGLGLTTLGTVVSKRRK